MLGWFWTWLEDVPSDVPAERGQAATIQLLAFLGVAWIAAGIVSFVARGLAAEHAFDVALFCLAMAGLLAAPFLFRAGRHRAAVDAAIAAISIPVPLLVTRGLVYGQPRIGLLALPLVVAALLAGRRALWLVFAGCAAAVLVGALRDRGWFGGPGPSYPAPVAFGVPGQALILLVVLSLVLDRFGGLLRDALANALRRESDLKASEERFRALFETSPDAMNLVRISDGVYVEVNDAFTRLTGWPREEMIGRTSAERDLWVDRAQRASLLDRLRRGEPVHEAEAEFRRRDGSPFIGLISVRGVVISGVAYTLGITRDVTERRRSEQEREALQAQLRHAQKMEAIGRLAGGIAHDFNNVLTSILASAQLVEDALPGDHGARPDVQQIVSDARRAAELTRQLLSFARKQDLAPQVMRVEERARSLETMLRRVCGASIQVETAFAADGWPVFADAGQVEQVILNLAVNARDAMPSGGRLAISTENVRVLSAPTRPGDPPPGEYLLLSVADTGVGMPPEVLAHAFEPFFTTKGSQGTGLGLATCFSIVAQAGGTIAVESAPGAGTRFRIHLPRAAAVVGPLEEPQVLDLRGGETIGVVEDDPGVRRLAVRSLQHLGYEVIDAGSVSEIQAKLSRRASALHALVMDVELPDGTGPEAVERIRNGRGAIPVLFVSGSPDAASPERGGAPFLPKPYSPVDLARRVRVLLGPAA